jgi:hypothetical protein
MWQKLKEANEACFVVIGRVEEAIPWSWERHTLKLCVNEQPSKSAIVHVALLGCLAAVQRLD